MVHTIFSLKGSSFSEKSAVFEHTQNPLMLVYICAMYVCMYVCMDGWMHGWMYVRMYACMHACV